MSLVDSADRLLDSIVTLPELIAEVASQGPVNVALVVLGALLVAAPVVILGYLSLGALLSLFTVESPRPRPREAE